METKELEVDSASLRRRTGHLWAVSGVLIVLAVCSMLFFRNPWLVHKMNADQASEALLSEIAAGTSPYVKIKGVKLSFTGYYTVKDDGEVRSYCYLANVGDQYMLVGLPADDGGALLEQSDEQDGTLEDYTLVGHVDRRQMMTTWLAEEEDMTLDEYDAYYQVIQVEVHGADYDREKNCIYQLMLAVLAIGTFAAGCILRSEAGSRAQKTQDEID